MFLMFLSLNKRGKLLNNKYHKFLKNILIIGSLEIVK